MNYPGGWEAIIANLVILGLIVWAVLTIVRSRRG